MIQPICAESAVKTQPTNRYFSLLCVLSFGCSGWVINTCQMIG